ncbi:hypothetical protein EN742_05930 [Mesorhizobium sp. M4A.F.Ca.ET.020.02.1.1]|uniref:hypothetical protein n=1 Tax=unclassified Mesorhizobium TaxID=325217 RepID=UPI000FCA501F|nr:MULTISPECIES: hypothetical protein [unclassified Mesorhizobium]RUX51442.1 hypothetical protein EOA33_06385 [Mesorhizobium sp. M4A.F.Ca.ET.050.02.1.1]RVD43063.1 hypothetical protein EN742_05930 [Mesorhizobium sp. M4A.F.Ca.ET.020.02.1.1]RWC14105.1 MAG: hypothetical protein EOS53_23065 [Mesorhizobium sp.]RWD33164.1 MAG: hypothetical protein EOS33_12080 [Mesorhizobium sp.]TIW19494.1 MAG: hypothetical protein E5V63_33340 [Mesorhizobium sp.]
MPTIAHIRTHRAPTATTIAFDTETHLQRARSYLRAIMMASSEITTDERDDLMLTNLTCAIDDEFDAIEKILASAA